MIFYNFKIIVFYTVVIFIFSCNSSTPYSHVPDDVRPILEKVIAQAGGLEKWNNSPGYQFNKRSILYLKDGTIESKNNQFIQIIDRPKLSGSITSNNRTDTINTIIEFKEDRAVKYIDGKVQNNMSNESARKTFLGAHMVMTLPFKLLDPGVKLTYMGSQEQFDKVVEVIRADYNVENDNHTESHTWWHYFDAGNFNYLGYKVYHDPTYALVEIESTANINGITYPADRVAWRIDSLENKQYVRARYAYSDFEIVAEK